MENDTSFEGDFNYQMGYGIPGLDRTSGIKIQGVRFLSKI